MRIEIKEDEITTALAGLQARLSDLTPVMRDIGEYLVTSTKARFATGKDPDGSAWKSKSQATLASYGARKSNRVDIRPLFGPSGSLSSQIFYEADATSVQWGSNRIYAAMMQFGGTKAAFPHLWGDIPARPFLGLSEDDRTNILDTITDALRGSQGFGFDPVFVPDEIDRTFAELDERQKAGLSHRGRALARLAKHLRG